MGIQGEGCDAKAAQQYQFVKNLIFGVYPVSAGLLKQGSPQKWIMCPCSLKDLPFHEGMQRLLKRKSILVLEADKLLVQVVTL